MLDDEDLMKLQSRLRKNNPYLNSNSSSSSESDLSSEDEELKEEVKTQNYNTGDLEVMAENSESEVEDGATDDVAVQMEEDKKQEQKEVNRPKVDNEPKLSLDTSSERAK